MAKLLEKVVLNEEGETPLAIQLQDNSNRWYARFKVNGKWKVKATAETNRDRAIGKAYVLLSRYQTLSENDLDSYDSARHRSKWFQTIAAPVVSTAGIADQSFSSDLPITPINLVSAFSDTDGDSLTYSISGAPAGIQLSGSSIEGSTSAGGVHTITVTASDGELTASTSFDLTIQDNSITGSYSHGYTTGNNMQWYRQDKWDLSYTSSSSLTYSTTGSGCSFGSGATTVTDAQRPSGVILYKAPQTVASNTSCSVTISNGSGVTENFTVNGQVKRIVAQNNSSCSIASRSDINRNDIRVVNPFSTVGTYNSYWMICHAHGCAYTSPANGGQVWQVLGWGDYPSATVSQARSGGAWSLCKVGW